MSKPVTPLEIYRYLPRTNCGQCGNTACLAFATAVVKQEKKLTGCPFLEEGAAADLEGRIARPQNLDTIRDDQVADLRKKLASVDVCARAALLGGRCEGPSLVIPCLGRDFAVTPDGTVGSVCHTHAWFTLPLLDYIVHCAGEPATGQWLPMRELPSGRVWGPLFEQRCEKPLKDIADDHRELFSDLVSLFCGVTSAPLFDADVAVVLYPLPLVPILICYWKREDDMDSKLHVFFDASAERNIPAESLFTLGTGLVRMFERIMYKHTDGRSKLA